MQLTNHIFCYLASLSPPLSQKKKPAGCGGLLSFGCRSQTNYAPLRPTDSASKIPTLWCSPNLGQVLGQFKLVGSAAKLHFSPLPPLLYTSPQVFDSLTIDASDPDCKTESNCLILHTTRAHLSKPVSKDARI